MSTDGPALKAARDLGQGWKVSPYVRIKPKETFVLADVQGMGAIQQIWMTPSGAWRFAILRFYWDGEKEPSIEAPSAISSPAAGADMPRYPRSRCASIPAAAFNSYWQMPFRKSFKVTLENIAEDMFTIYYQINYTLTEIPDDAAYFHAQFRRVNPLPYKRRLYDPRRRQRMGPLRRDLHGLGRQQQRLVGRRRDQVLPRRRHEIPDHLRDGDRGLFLRLI